MLYLSFPAYLRLCSRRLTYERADYFDDRLLLKFIHLISPPWIYHIVPVHWMELYCPGVLRFLTYLSGDMLVPLGDVIYPTEAPLRYISANCFHATSGERTQTGSSSTAWNSPVWVSCADKCRLTTNFM
jgi:hypothetical protein